MPRIKGIAFCFENLEQYFVPMEAVEYIGFDKIHTSISNAGNRLAEMVCAEEALAILKPTADKKAESSFSYLGKGDKKILGLFERLSLWQDCVGIDVIFESEQGEEDNREEIYVPWEDGKDEYTNRLQTTFIQNNETLRGHGYTCVHFGEAWTLIDKPVSQEDVSAGKDKETNFIEYETLKEHRACLEEMITDIEIRAAELSAGLDEVKDKSSNMYSQLLQQKKKYEKRGAALKAVLILADVELLNYF